jgi:hypothetical protein
MEPLASLGQVPMTSAKKLIVSRLTIAVGVSWLLLASGALSSCQSQTCDTAFPKYPRITDTAKLDRSLTTGEPCMPPCWQGLVPGESTEEDVMAVLETAPFVEGGSIMRAQTSDGDEATIRWGSSASDLRTSAGVIYITNGRVSLIDIQIEYRLTRQELVSIIGEPDGYFVLEIQHSGPRCFSYSVPFIWLEEGFVAGPSLTRRDPVPKGEDLLSPDMFFIEYAYYSSPFSRPMDALMGTGLDEASAQLAEAKTYREWQGFDTITIP